MTAGIRPSALTIGLLLLCCPVIAAAETPSVETIVEKTNLAAYYQGRDGRAEVEMVITDAQGRRQRRQLTLLRRNEQQGAEAIRGGQKYFVLFHRPADVNKTAFLVWKHLESEDDRWLYLPALDLVRRIAASDERTSFVGSHFFYEDVSGRRTDEDDHQLVETTESYFVLRNVPKDPSRVEFSSFTMWIHRETFIPVKIEYYDASGTAYRIYEALGVETIQGYPTVVKARMRDLRTDGETTVEYENVRYDLGLPDDIFSERYLRNPPQAYLR